MEIGLHRRKFRDKNYYDNYFISWKSFFEKLHVPSIQLTGFFIPFRTIRERDNKDNFSHNKERFRPNMNISEKLGNISI